MTFIDNAEDLDIVMSMYNLLEYGKNYSMAPGIFRNYYRNEMMMKIYNVAIDHRINNNKITTGKSFEYKTNLMEMTSNNNGILNPKVLVPLKY